MGGSDTRTRRARLVVIVVSAGLAVSVAMLTLLQGIRPDLGQRLSVLLATIAAVTAALDRLVTLLPVPPPPSDDEVRRTLDDVRRVWMRELEQSLGGQDQIEVRLAERAGVVDDRMGTILRGRVEPDGLWPRGTPISTAYRELGERLLILGQPGAGKSTQLLRLAQQLLKKADVHTAGRLPLVFPLSSWADEQRPVAAWLVDELVLRYGVPPSLSRALVDRRHIIPLLDGLNEVSDDRRGACVSAINAFHDQHRLLPMVVCSRPGEYEGLQEKLELGGAVMIQPLTRREVDRYLQRGGDALTGVRAAVSQDEQLRELSTTPLFLSIVSRAYRGRPAAATRASGSLEERRHRVLADYVDAQLSPEPQREPPPYSPEKAIQWLRWLALAMRAHGQSVFYPDWIQPDWLPSRAQRRRVTVGLAVRIGLVTGLLAGLAIGLFNGVVVVALHLGPIYGLSSAAVGVIAGSIVGLDVGLVAGLSGYAQRIVPTERLRWSWAAVGRGLRQWRVLGLAIGLLFGIVAGLAFRPAGGRVGGLAVGSGVWSGVAVGTGLIAGLAGGLESRPYQAPLAPERIVRRSGRNGLVSGLVAGSITVLGSGAIILLLGLLFFGLGDGLGTGAVAAVASLFVGGLVAGLAMALVIGLAVGVAVLGRSWLDRLLVGMAAVLALVMGSLPALGLLVGVTTGLQRGGGAYLRHRALRRLLVQNGTIPRDQVAFLEYAVRRSLLRRAGSGYEFIHPLVRDHIAALGPAVGNEPGPVPAPFSVPSAPASPGPAEPR